MMFPMATSQEWLQIWSNIHHRSRAILSEFLENNSLPLSSEPVHMAIFDPEIVTETVFKALSSLAERPANITHLQSQYLAKMAQLLESTYRQMKGEVTRPVIEGNTKDRRFQDPLWQEHPLFSLYHQTYLLNAQHLQNLVKSIQGLDENTTQKLHFYTRQLIDAFSPSNFPTMNPTVITETIQTQGENLVQGFRNLLRDTVDGQIRLRMTDLDAFELGKNIATTSGKIVYQNDLFQLIQYEPLTETVAREPLLIIPPWINKYYIFDLREDNSFVQWAISSGLTVFMISWVNPDERHSKMTLSNYVLEGAKRAIDEICSLTGEDHLNVIGYCTGGIILSCLINYMHFHKDNRLKSASIFATPVDFTEGGDLLTYTCERQLAKMDEHIRRKGYLEGQSMVNSFNLLRSNDLIWTFVVNNYLLGKEPLPFDMLYWNTDALRMPGRMHIEYLRQMYLENRLIQPGGIQIKNVPVDLRNITVPTFIMAAIDDHIAPWKSAYPLSQLVGGATQFVLSASGHVAGVINHPNREKYHYWRSDTLALSPEKWLEQAEMVPGSWWIEWRRWLKDQISDQVPARLIHQERVLEMAPGSYALTMAD